MKDTEYHRVAFANGARSKGRLNDDDISLNQLETYLKGKSPEPAIFLRFTGDHFKACGIFGQLVRTTSLAEDLGMPPMTDPCALPFARPPLTHMRPHDQERPVFGRGRVTPPMTLLTTLDLQCESRTWLGG